MSTSGSTELTATDKYLPKLFFGSSHLWALSKLETLPKSARILDIGTGSGIIGESLKEKGYTELFGVEPDKTAAENCRKIYKEIHGSSSGYDSEKFDAVIMLDVLEHIANPEQFFSHATKLLNPGAVVIVSVPNLYHWSIRLLLLFGLLEYTHRGIFDKTHLQFFSQRRLGNLFKEGGVEIRERNASISPAEFVLPASVVNTKAFRIFSEARLFCARAWRNLGAYQFLVEGVKK